MPTAPYSVNSAFPRPAGEPPTWRQAIKAAVRDPAELCRRLRLPASFAQSAVRASEQFPLFAPLEYVARMKPGDPSDPLLRQVLPVSDECEAIEGFLADPV
ncbi:MAG: EF-P beta-lysylation protein EpmB, partial [Planctomycetes bacterium]|nr:EF-P beta-lysylation protein EpmB [Planctomycetota bacterium]